MDTSVWIARWSPEEAQHAPARRVLAALQEEAWEGWSSVLLLFEVAAVASRRWSLLPEEARARWSREDAVAENLDRSLASGLRWIHLPGDLALAFARGAVTLPTLVAEGLGLAASAPLKALDLLHLAAARYANRVQGLGLERFVTLDRDFLERRGELTALTGLTFETPGEVAAALGL